MSFVGRTSFFCVGFFGADGPFFVEGGLTREDGVGLADAEDVVEILSLGDGDFEDGAAFLALCGFAGQ